MLYKNSIKKIKRSFGRYFSLLIIIFLGVGFYSGIQGFAPNMESTANNYYNDFNLLDFKIVSTVGLTDDDIKMISTIDKIEKVISSYSIDALAGDKSIRIHSIEDINKINLISGKIPNNNDECLADEKEYKIGDIITITSNVDDILISKKYEVVGTMKSVLYVANDYGNTSVGTGKLDSFIFINSNSFKYDIYTELYITLKGNNTAYTSSYKELVTEVKEELNKIKATREKERTIELKEQIKSEILKENPILNDYPEMLDEAIEEVEISEVKWYIFDREVSKGYNQLELDVEVVQKVADILPIFFIIIVILMTSNTMNRMITEERGEMGTLSSLGYRNSSIISTYLLYVLSATFIGVTIGYFACGFILPKIIYNVFPYNFADINIEYNLVTFLIVLLISSLLMITVVLYSCIRELKDRPSKLFRPIPPKNGQKIVLEHIKFLWKKTSFTWKITLRNIFRYKKRVLMTIIGIAGCTGLLLVGFGIKDSINGIGDKQYSKIFKYQSMLVLNNNVSSLNPELESKLKENNIVKPLLLNQTAYEAIDSKNKIDMYLITVSDKNLFKEYYDFKTENDNTGIELKNDSAIITDKLARLLKLNVGDKISITTNGETYSIAISHIVKNYIMNYVFISDTFYKENINEDLSYNIIVSNYDGNKENVATSLIENKLAISIDFSENLIEKANNTIGGLDSIVALVIIISALLAFIVLYNLTSINISERTREVATVKVLGFTDIETNEYIYRETMILTALGILFGLGLGILLHSYVINIIGIETVSYFKNIKLVSFILAVIISFIFSLLMEVITYFKLKDIDMIESLKSVE